MRALQNRWFGGCALIEPLIAIAIVSVTASSTLWSFFFVNRYATNQRLVGGAKAFCQERIDDALTLPLSSTSVPALFGAVRPMPGAETLTSTETLPLYIRRLPQTTDWLADGCARTVAVVYLS